MLGSESLATILLNIPKKRTTRVILANCPWSTRSRHARVGSRQTLSTGFPCIKTAIPNGLFSVGKFAESDERETRKSKVLDGLAAAF
jgi:hypothetical protein